MKHENNVTLSVYCYDITVLTYNRENRTTEELTFSFYNEKLPSDEILKKELSECYGVNIVDILEKSLNTEKSGLFKLSHRDFTTHAERIGETREKKNK